MRALSPTHSSRGFRSIEPRFLGLREHYRQTVLCRLAKEDLATIHSEPRNSTAFSCLNERVRLYSTVEHQRKSSQASFANGTLSSLRSGSDCDCRMRENERKPPFQSWPLHFERIYFLSADVAREQRTSDLGVASAALHRSELHSIIEKSHQGSKQTGLDSIN
jgi:hypothetical protein